MKKILMIIAPDFRDPEYFEPKKIFEGAGIEVTTASFEKGEIQGADGARARADLLLEEIDPADFEGVVFVGGPGMVDKVGDPSLINLARRFFEAGKLTTAICISPAILAKAGILEGKKATIWSGAKDALEEGKALYSGEPVTVEGPSTGSGQGRIVTANGPAAAEEFGKTIVDLL